MLFGSKIKMDKIKFLFLLTPIYLLLYRVLSIIFSIKIPLHEFWVFAWLIYYLLGIYYKKGNRLLKIKYLNLVYIICFFFEIIYSFWIYNRFGFSLALSQMNIVNMIISILLFEILNPYLKKMDDKKNILSKIGDYSFGIFFIHMILLKVLKKGLLLVVNDTLLVVILVSILTLISSYLIVCLCNKVFPKKWIKYIGF